MKEQEEFEKNQEAKEEEEVKKVIVKQKKKKEKSDEDDDVPKLDGVEEGKIEIVESNVETEKAKRIAEESKQESIQMMS